MHYMYLTYTYIEAQLFQQAFPFVCSALPPGAQLHQQTFSFCT